MFAVGEGIEATQGWWGHLIQLAIGAGLGALASFVPKVGGPLLIVLGVVPVILMLSTAAPAGVVASSVGIVWLPLVLSGVFSTLAGYARRPVPPTPDRPAV